MNLNDFDYPLPKELVAQRPLAERDTSRLLVVDRKKNELYDRTFSDILEYIPSGDLLLLNNTKVFQARLMGRKKRTEGKVDILLLHPYAPATPLDPEDSKKILWKCLVQPALRETQEVELGDGVEAVFVKRDLDGVPVLEFRGVMDVKEFARKKGLLPLPPYIKRETEASDDQAYQTVYAAVEGAVAAPTAGLHFTPELLKRIEQKGVEIHFVTLHVGYGTFRPVEDLENHVMHSEYFELSPRTAEKVNAAKAQGRKIWAVGTTTLRVLETCVQNKRLIPGSGQTDLYIREPFEFEAVDHLVTNFHLPKTTLLLLVSALMGEPLRKRAYDHAIAQKYRFYSYGDAMLIL
jgi:S-adenosylmethionine:tRNA ribosyltransferase-isomerase